MRVLITGGSGFIGRYLIDHLKKSHQLFVTGRGEKDLFPNSTDILYLQTDYSHLKLLDIFKRTKPDAVVHLAAKRPVRKGDQSDFVENISITNTLFEVCQDFKVRNIINISSISVYSEFDKKPWNEKTNPTPMNRYGLSKIWGEQACEFFNNLGLNIKTLRIAQVIGLGDREEYVLQIFLKNALNQQPLAVYGAGEGKRHYVYVKDVVGAIVKALDKPKLRGIFNIAMKNNSSFIELAKTINRVFDNNAGIQKIEDETTEILQLMSIEKAMNDLAWKPKFDLYKTYTDMKIDLKSSPGIGSIDEIQGNL